MSNHFLATTLPGIAPIAIKYLRAQLGQKIGDIQSRSLRSNDLLDFHYEGQLEPLLRPAMFEDIYLHLANVKLEGTKQDLLQFKKIANRLNLQKVISLWGGKKAHSIRVVVQAEDAYWRKYRRLDIKSAFEAGLIYHPANLKVVPEDANLELWAQQIDHELVVSARLTDKTMRHREYKIADYPGSLRPTIASAMVFLSQPSPTDIVLDPMCGAGTILIERALDSRYKLLLGFDNNPSAIEATLENFGKRHKPWEINLGDVTRLRLEKDSVNVILTNPPWGVQMSAGSDFYAQMMNELQRVLQPAGKLVILIRQNALRKSYFYEAGFHIKEHYSNISVLGQRAEIFVCVKNIS